MEDIKSSFSEKVFCWWDYPVFLSLTAAILITVFYFFQYWFSLQEWKKFPLLYLAITLLFLVFLINYSGRWFLLPKMRKPPPVLATPGFKVAVVTTFVPAAEPLGMLRETVKAMLALEYPHDSWVLDEGDDEEVKAMCRELGANHFTRKHSPEYQSENGIFKSRSKHGNYNAWLYRIAFDGYDVISAFDPDHIPQPNYLNEVLGYFNNPEIGYVQVAPGYYNQKASFIARGAAEETYAYHSSVQMASFAMGYPIIIGSHNTHRVSALKQVGGFAPHDADDLLMTMLYRAHGWQGVYVPRILARGITPVDWSGYLLQQQRWARSVMDLKFRFYPKISSKLPLKTRVMSFLHGLNYLHKSMTILMGLGLLIFMLLTGNSAGLFSYRIISKLAVLFAVLQVGELYRQRFYLDWRNEWGIHWRAILLQFAKWPFFLLAFFEVISSRPKGYVLTKKTKSKSGRFMLLWPHLFVVFIVCAAWIVGLISHQNLDSGLHVCAAVIVLSTVALILTTVVNFPDPFDENLFVNRSQKNF